MLDLFKADVAAYRESKVDGPTWDSKSVKTRLESIIAKDVRFIKPLDQFYPSRLYKQGWKKASGPRRKRKKTNLTIKTVLQAMSYQTKTPPNYLGVSRQLHDLQRQKRF